jgi:hypothetical protein
MKKFIVLFILVLAVSLSGTARADWNATNLLLNGDFETPDPCGYSLTCPANSEPNRWGHLQPGFDTGLITGAYINYVSPLSPTPTLASLDPGTDGDRYSNAWLVGGAHSGSSLIAMALDSNSLATSYALCYQTHPCAEKRSYRLEAYVWIPNGKTITKPELKIDFKNASGTFLRTDIKDCDIATYSTWQYVTMDSNGIAPEGSRSLGAAIGTGKTTAGGTAEMYWDDVKLTMLGAAPSSCEQLQFASGVIVPGRKLEGTPTTWDFAVGDLNRDCVIDFKDYAIFAGNWLVSNALK